MVTAILVAALTAGDIDGVLLARESPIERWKGVAHLATTAEEVRESGGSFYNQTMGLAHLDLRGYDLPPEPRIAVVGTPCEIQGINAMRDQAWHRRSAQVDTVVLTIALLCTKSFDYQGLVLGELRDKRGLELDEIGKVDVIKGNMIVEDRAGATMVSEPVRDFHGVALRGCDECADFLGRGADISVGSVGSADGYSSVLVRTDAGNRAFLRAAPEMELANLERPDALSKLDAYDRKVTLAHMQRDFDPEGALFVSYTEHARAYAGSDRAPVPDRPIEGGPLRARDDSGATDSEQRGDDGPAKDLAIPPEPVAERQRVGSLVLEHPEAWKALAGSGEWIADVLWPWWGAALEQVGLDMSSLAEVAAGYRIELWLWLMGQHTWEDTAAGLAGRLQRRACRPAPKRATARKPSAPQAPARQAPARRASEPVGHGGAP